MTSAIIGIIVAGLVFIGLVALLLRILGDHPIVTMVFRALSALGLIIASFAMPAYEQFEDISGWAFAQGALLFLYFVVASADIAFEIDEHEEEITTDRERWDGSYERTTERRTVRRSMFWSVLGLSLFGAGILVWFNYGVFDSAVFLGVVGCIAFAWMLITLIKFLLERRKKRGYYR